MIERLLGYISLVSEEQIKGRLEEAKMEIGSRDPDDVVFLATALLITNSALWSDDKDFEEQRKVRILKTKEMVRLFSYE